MLDYNKRAELSSPSFPPTMTGLPRLVTTSEALCLFCWGNNGATKNCQKSLLFALFRCISWATKHNNNLIISLIC